MDIVQENEEEDRKYAFLLGSALKNEDPDQLLIVYDKLIPDHISISRLENIKEGARHISELPDDEFNSLVLKARTYSLAPGLFSMSQADRRRSSVTLSGVDHEDSSSSSLTHDEPSCCSSLSKAQATLSVNIDLGVPDEDSGLPDSYTKASSSLKNSYSDSNCGDSEEERPGAFDYNPSPYSCVRITPTYNPVFDEEVKLDSSTGGSSIESPRSETSVTHDEYNLMEEGTEMETLDCQSIPPSLANEHRRHNSYWDYMPGPRTKSNDDDDDDEKEEEDEQMCRTSTNLQPFRLAPVPVDSAVALGLAPRHDERPAFRMATKPYQLLQETLSGKDKTKCRSKDDSDKPELSGTVDVNGNPLQVNSKEHYLQMRQPPSGKSDGAASGSVASFTPAQTTSFSQGPSGNEDINNKWRRKQERRKQLLEKQKGTPAKDLYTDLKQEFTDIKDLDKLLSYIEGNNSNKKSHKENNSSDIGKVESKAARKKQERSKKRDQPLNGSLTSDDKTAEETTCSSGQETGLVTLPCRSGPGAMGNNIGKAGEDHSIVSRPGCIEEDKTTLEFHDCLSTLTREPVQHSSLGEYHKFAFSSLETDSSSHAYNSDKLHEDNPKTSRKLKANSKKDKQDVCGDNGPLSPKVNLVKPKDGLETDSVTRSNNTNILDAELHPELKREDSFTEVKKKKKRATGKDTLTAPTSAVASHYPQNTNGALYRSIPRPRPSTPPPSSSTISTVVSTDPSPMPRDLSPSSFPVLPGHGPVSSHMEGRRNSCGDISADCMDSKTYDSDRESAKSLPAAHGPAASGELSPVYPMSYARIAAAPRRYDSNNSPSSESGVASGSHNSSVNSSVTHTPGSSIDIMSPQSPANPTVTPDRKATVWKGSPRERRHSIGSSPEDKSEGEKNSVAQRNRQCGSQEVLSRNLATAINTPSKEVVNTIPCTTAKLIHTSQNANSQQSVDNAQEKTIQPPIKIIASYPQNVQNTAGLLSTRSSSHQAGSNTSLPQQASGVKVAETSTNADSVKKTAFNVKSPEVSSKSKAVGPVAEGVKKNGGSTNNTKSVVFLDKPFDASPPHNLGITFGFDSTLESMLHPASQSQPQLITNVPSLLSPAAQHRPSHIPTAAPAALSIASSLHSSDSSQVAKSVHNQGPRNGLILPSSASHQQSQVASKNSLCSDKSGSDPSNSIASSGRTSSSADIDLNSVPDVSHSRCHMGLAYSPNHPPPLVPAGMLSTSSSSRTHSPAENPSLSQSTEAREEADPNENLPAKVRESPQVMETVSTTKETTAAGPQLQLGPEIISSAMPVVYGLKIKPGGGCGKLMFLPPSISKKVPDNSVEVSNFLRKKWSEVANQGKSKSNHVID